MDNNPNNNINNNNDNGNVQGGNGYVNDCGSYGSYSSVAGQYPPPEAPQKKGVSLFYVIIIVALAVVVTFQATTLWYHHTFNGKDSSIPSYFDNALIIDEYLRGHYIGDMDEEYIRQFLSSAILYASGDEHAYYYTPEEYAAENRENDGGGIGIGIASSYRQDYYVDVTRVFDGSPASIAGVRRGDVIVAVGGKDLSMMSYHDFTTAMMGEIGSTVNITVKRGEELIDFTITRNTYTLQTVDGHMYKDGATDKKIGVVQIFSFNYSTTEQFKNVVNSLIEQGAQGLVFDVRDNPGGTLTSVVEMLDFLLPEGKIVRITDKNGTEVQSYTSDSSCIDLPMVVLTNAKSASASELFTSALKDHQKAISVGTKSFGKGTMQIMIPLPDGGAFKFSYRYYSPPFSDNFDGIGITPDIEITLPQGTKLHTLTDENDPQLAAAVEHILNEK